LAANPHVRYERRTLGGLDKDEMLAFFKAHEKNFPALRDLDDSVRYRLWEVTEGRPIRLDLALEVVQRQIGFDRFWHKIEKSPPEKAREEIDRLLIENVMGSEPDSSVRDVLRYLAVARKGLNAELLRHLAGEWDIHTCQQKLDAIADRSFIKQRPQDDHLFLHEQMYDLCDRYLLQPAQAQDLSYRVVEWYDEQIEACSSGREGQTELRNYQVDSLLYRLRADPRAGYEWYAKLVDGAIRGVEVGFDMRLRSEVLAFLKSQSPIDQSHIRNVPTLLREIYCDCAARWAKRYIMRGQRENAIRIGERVFATSRGPCPSDDPCFRLGRADLAVLHAEALIYAGGMEEALAGLKAAIADLEDEQRPEVLAQQEPRSFVGWRRNLVLGRGHNDCGYAYWHQGRYELALQEFRSALPYFRASDLLEETANTDDNLGRVYALLYHRSRAESLVEDGLQLRNQLGREYRYALSLNSQAIIHLAFGEPHRAYHVSKEALRIFEQLTAERGMGLACITLGRSLRHLGGLWTGGIYGASECVSIFEDVVEEPMRLIESYNELGCAHRERAALARSVASESPLARSIARGAVQHLTMSIQLAKKTGATISYVDSCEDLAQTYFQRRDFDNAEVWLRRAEEEIPNIYKIEKGRGLRDIPLEERIEEFWQQLGKIELLRGYLVYEQGVSDGKVSRQVLEQAMPHYVFAAAYFERYSERATGLETTFKQLYRRFKLCKIEDLRHVQRQVLPSLAKTYGLEPLTVGTFFEDTLGLAAEWQP
jgi:tetratricopeptide (TPR) repeat protein